MRRTETFRALAACSFIETGFVTANVGYPDASLERLPGANQAGVWVLNPKALHKRIYDEPETIPPIEWRLLLPSWANSYAITEGWSLRPAA